MPLTRGTVDDCERTLLSLEAEADSALERFVETLEHGRKFHSSLEKIEEQIEIAKRKLSSDSEMELNEASVLAEKLSDELSAVHSMASGAALTEAQDGWSEQFEDVRASLDKLSSQLRKMKAHSHQAGEGAEARILHMNFARESKKCKARLDSLLKSFNARSRHHTRANAAKRKVELIRASVGKSFSKLTRRKLAKKVSEARAEIESFLKKHKSGRIFVDHKHLTITSNGSRMRVPLTQSVRFSLEDIVPVEKSMAKLGSAVLVGSFEEENGRQVLRIGERSLVGDSIVFREKSYYLN